MIKNLIKYNIPKPILDIFRKMRGLHIRKYKSPKMIYGYRDSTGVYRPRTRISDTVFMNYPDRIIINDNVFIGHYPILDGIGGIEIGEGCQLSAWVGIFTHSSHIAIRLYGEHYLEIPENEKAAYQVKPVRIGKYVFIGAKSIILPGVVIGDGSIVSAGSIVRGYFGKHSIISGNPAKAVGSTKDLDKKYLHDQQLMNWYEEWQEVEGIK